MKNFPVTKKLQLGIAALVLLTAISSAINLLAFKKVEAADSEFKVLNETNRNLNHFLNLITSNTLGYMDAIVDKDSGDVDEAIVKKHFEFMEWTKANKAMITQEIMHINKDFNSQEFTALINKYWTAGDRMLKDIKNKKTDELGKYDDDIDRINESVGLEISKNLELSNKLFLAAAKEVEYAQKLISNCTIFSFFAMIIFGFSIAYYIMKSIGATLEQSSSTLNTGTETVLKSSRDFSDLGIKIKNSTNKQASSLHDSVSAIDQIKATVDRNAVLSNDSVNLADTCVEYAQKGKKSIEEMIVAVAEIEKGQNQTNKILEATSSEIQEMVAVIKGIGAKTDVINDIVFQTKLLSFNASVEAARAGEHGKGFAVVAEEVGNLAAMSGNAAREINELLNGSISKVELIVSKTQQNTKEISRTGSVNIETGTRTTNNCNIALDDIYENVTRMKEIIREINSSSNEQATGIGSIQSALVDLDHITNENVISAEQCASSAEQLNSHSLDLKNAVVGLMSEIKGAA